MPDRAAGSQMPPLICVARIVLLAHTHIYIAYTKVQHSEESESLIHGNMKLGNVYTPGWPTAAPAVGCIYILPGRTGPLFY